MWRWRPHSVPGQVQEVAVGGGVLVVRGVLAACVVGGTVGVAGGVVPPVMKNCMSRS